jgi:hypothetical protein
MITSNGLCLSDLHKEAYGFRPGPAQYARWKAASKEELLAEEAYLLEAGQIAIREEAENEAGAAVRFEAHIGKLMADHRIDRATAIRWDIAACGLEEDVKVYGMDVYRYEHGLAYGYFA